MIIKLWQGLKKSTIIYKRGIFWQNRSYDSRSRAANFMKFAEFKREPIPKRDEIKKTTWYESFAISSSFQNSFYLHDRFSVTARISILAGVGKIDEHSICRTIVL